MTKLKSIIICAIAIFVLCSCSKPQVEYTDVQTDKENKNFLLSLDEACAKIESSGYIEDILIEKMTIDSMALYRLEDSIELRVFGNETVSRFSITAPQEQSSNSIIGNSLGAIFMTIYPSGFINDEYTNLVYEIAEPIESGKYEQTPIYYKHLRVLCDVEKDKTTLIISADGDRKPKKDLQSETAPLDVVVIADSEKDVDVIYAKAKKDSEIATIESVEFALNYIVNNYDDFYSDADTMERIMYYGCYLDFTCRDRNMTYEEIGVNSFNAVKDVYRNFETKADDYSKLNYEQVGELITQHKLNRIN